MPKSPGYNRNLEPPRGVAQLAEHRSPKPGVAGSSPAAPAGLNELAAVGHMSSIEMRARSKRGRSASSSPKEGRILGIAYSVVCVTLRPELPDSRLLG
jgi:hypothetical protein